MRQILTILFISLLFSNSALAKSLLDVLKEAYQNNTELNAERENLIISEQELKISKSDYLPSATITSSKSQEDTNKLTNQSGGDATISDVDPLSTSIKIEQTLIDFSRSADYKKKKIGIDLAREKLLKKEQEILYKAIEAYSSLIAAIEKEEINKKNVELKISQLETDRIRLERGEVKLSDLAQSESSLAGAEAKYIQSQNELITSKLNYENVIGAIAAKENLKKIYNAQVSIPKNLNEAKKISLEKSPELIIAEIEYGQSELDVKIARSDLSPTAKISLERTYTDDLSATYDEREKDVLQATVSWPFQFGGKNKSNVSKNLQAKGMKRLLLENAQKNNTQSVTSSWSTLQSSRSFLQAVQSQVKAAEIATEGISFEYESGSGRSTFDVLQSRSSLINAKINLAEAERSYLLAQYRVLKSVGLLNSDYLNLK